MSDSELVQHGPCPTCGSSDANAEYTDGHTHCFSCGTTVQQEGAGGKKKKKKKAASAVIHQGEVLPLGSRKITQPTCAHFGYLKVVLQGEPFYSAPYYDTDGQLVAQKLRGAGKDFRWRGEAKPLDVLPFGSHAFPRRGKKVVVTEGEIDAMAMSQAQGNKWPTVSIPTGGEPKAVRKYFARHMEYFEGFDQVVLMFDMDPVGRAASEAAAEVLGSRAAIASLPLKDASDMLRANRAGELLAAMWGAVPYRPEGIVDLASLKEEVLKPVEWGLSWPFEALTKLTYGIRLGELYAVGAGTGVGKTDFFTQTMAHLLEAHGVKVGIFALEQEPKETGVRLMGKLAQRPFHIPDAGWSPDELQSAWDDHVQAGRVFLYDSFGVNDWEAVRSKIRYLRDSEGVKYFFLDHLTALAAAEEDERIALDRIMADMGSLVKEIPITIFFISHLATPDGKPHEEGGRVMIRHFRGSRAIGFWAHYMFGLERDQQAENARVRSTTTFRVLKDRYTGRSTGEVFFLGYDHETGYLFETSDPEASADTYGFTPDLTDDTPPNDDF